MSITRVRKSRTARMPAGSSNYATDENKVSRHIVKGAAAARGRAECRPLPLFVRGSRTHRTRKGCRQHLPFRFARSTCLDPGRSIPLPISSRARGATTCRSLDALNFFLADVHGGLGPYLAVYLLTARHWNEAEIGIVMSIAGLAGILAQTPAGVLVDAARGEAGHHRPRRPDRYRRLDR